jgi:hypothetical protein
VSSGDLLWRQLFGESDSAYCFPTRSLLHTRNIAVSILSNYEHARHASRNVALDSDPSGKCISKGAGAGLRSAGLGVATILAEQPSDDDGREHNAPNGPRDGSEALRAAVPVQDVCDIEQEHAAGLASVGNREDAL